MFLRFLAGAAALLLLLVQGQAALTWQNPVQSFELLPDASGVEARFPFKNSGSTPVTITKLKTSCGCTTAKLEKRTYAPGETGEVTANYHFRGQKGALRKLVTVSTDDQAEPQVLDIRAFVHEPFAIKPGLVFWRSGTPAEAKIVTLTAENYPVQVKSIRSNNPQVTAKLTTVKASEEYQITLQPTDTTQKLAAEITVETDFPQNAPRTYTIYARVK